MEPVDDSALLRQYAEKHSDEAFAELVARHVNLVYSVALRRAGHPQNAEEITQAVFIILAKKAAGLRHERALSSWLFQTTRLTAINFVRSEIRRRHREEEAQMQTMLNESGGEVWPKIAPLLDDAVAALREKERRAIVLRFYEGRSLREVGLALGASEDAAKKRVGRALEKLRQSFAKRGVDSTTTAIAETISANSILVAPAALAKTTTAAALAKGASVSASTLTLIKGALKIMAWTKMKTVIVASVVVLLAAGTTTIIVRQIIPSQPTVAHLAAARDYYNKAMKHYMSGEYEAELADLNQAITLNPKYMEALFSRGCLYGGDLPEKQRDYAKAIMDYTGALDANPRDCSARFNRAFCYDHVHQPDKAIADYTRIISGDTDFSRIDDGKDKEVALALDYRGRLYSKNKNFASAVTDYTEALRLDPDIINDNRGWIFSWRADAYHALKKYAEEQQDLAAYARIQGNTK